jgi:mxaK protein
MGMTRTFVHAVFGTIALLCAAAAAYDWTRLQHAAQVNQQMAAAATSSSRASPANSNSREDHTNDEPPQVRLARATALSKAGSYDMAAKLYDGLIHDDNLDALGRTALFDLGNMFLRQGTADGAGSVVKSVAMIGEAKARYRILLRAAPGDWDARYNLERALWLAPESRSALEEPDVKSQHNVKVKDPQSKDLP